MSKYFYTCIIITTAALINSSYGFGIVSVSGSSMEPTLNDGDKKVYCKKCDAKVGDIVIYKDESILEGTILIKRITKKEDNMIFLNGDNLSASTDSDDFGMVDEKNIIGVLVLNN